MECLPNRKDVRLCASPGDQERGGILENARVKRELRQKGKVTTDTTGLLLTQTPGQAEKSSDSCGSPTG